MADNRTSQLLAASFKGVPFSVRSESAPEAGRKLVLHDYVNSSERFVEDQGQIPPKFSVIAFVHGADFIARAGRLEQVLNEAGPGRLSLPVFGVISAYAGAYSKNASQLSVGEISYTIPFYAGRPAPGPSLSRTGVPEVYQAGDEARSAVGVAFSGLLKPPTTSLNAQSIVGDLNAILSDIETAVNSILPVDDLGEFLRTIERLELDGSSIVRDPASLGRDLFAGVPKLPGMWQRISLGLSRVSDFGISQLTALTNLGGGSSLSANEVGRAVPASSAPSSIPLWPPTTGQRVDRNSGRVLLSQSNRVSALVGLYEVAAGRTYATDTEIDRTRTSIENLHERIMRVETSDTSLIQSDPAVRSSVEDVRLAALDVLGQKEHEAFQITTNASVVPTSALVRSYALYAEEFTDAGALTARATQIGGMNTAQSSASMSGEFNIFKVT